MLAHFLLVRAWERDFLHDPLLAIDQLDCVEGLCLVLAALCPHRPLCPLPAQR